MKVITAIKGFKLKRGSVVSVGVFDGLHIGHQLIIKRELARARKLHLPACVVTFSPHPLSLLEPQNAPQLLISLPHRLRLLEELGVDISLVLKFTRTLSKLSPEVFMKRYLIDAFSCKVAVVGPGFFFGRYRDGDVFLLKKLGKLYHFNVDIVEPVKFKGEIVSSTHIRWLIRSGELDEAKILLGRPVSVLGTVVRGSSLASELGYPTANVNPHHEVIPPSGVYAVKVNYKDKIYGGILNIGTKPTFAQTLHHSLRSGAGQAERIEPSIEVHIFNFAEKIYGKDLEINFVKKIREERKFSDRAALVEQIKKDEKIARSILK